MFVAAALESAARVRGAELDDTTDQRYLILCAIAFTITKYSNLLTPD